MTSINPSRGTIVFATLAALLATVAHAQTPVQPKMDHSKMDHSKMAPAAAGANASTKGYQTANDRMHKDMGIAFTGDSYGESFVLADVHLSGSVPADEVRLYFSPGGMMVVAPLPDGVHRIVAPVDDAPEQPSAAYVQGLLDTRGPQAERAVVGDVLWGSRFRVHHRVADSYRAGRVLLAGDAAHVHSPAGGQGMNAGILDAMALAGALRQALAGNPAALDDYGAQRRPVAQQVVAFADRLTRLATVRPALRALRNAVLGTLARLPPFRKQLAWRLSGLVYR